MGRLVVTEFVTLDGVMDDPGGAEGGERGGWAFQFDRGEAGNAFKLSELMASDAQLLGRVTYEGFAKAWPTMEGTGAFGEKMNAMPKFVVSATLAAADWSNTTILRGNDLAAEVADLKTRFDGDILVAGSARLVQSLLALDLVDVVRLMVFPVLLGGGKRLFADGELRRFSIAEAVRSADVALLTLVRER